jgi:predicted RNase H-like HicB family nuclease
MNKKTYFLAVYENEKGSFDGDFADFECVVDQGDTLEELISNARDLLNFFVADMVQSGVALPEPSDGKNFKAKLTKNPFCIVPVTIYPPSKTERINITATGELLAEITDYAKKNKLSRSELMVQSTIKYIRNNA